MASPDQNPDNLAGDALATASDAATSWLSGIPTPIRQNAFKAFGRLCTAVIDIPVAMLEGVAAEKRAETQARVKIISTGADQIATQMSVGPEYARAAVKKYGERIVREQMNLDKASEVAALELKNAPFLIENGEDASAETTPIDDDWLNNFEKEASQKSTEHMQRMFGRILAGESESPLRFPSRP